MCVQQSCIQCACHYYGSFASVIKSVPYYVVSTSLIRCVKLRSGVSGRFKRPGHWGLTSPLCRILPQKIFKKALYVCEPPPPFSNFRICKYRVCFLIAYLFFFLVSLFAKRTFDMCHSCTLRKYTRCAPHYILPNTNNLATYRVISTEK